MEAGVMELEKLMLNWCFTKAKLHQFSAGGHWKYPDCEKWRSESFRGFCVPLTEVKPFVKESEEAPLERILCCFTAALVVFSVSSCSSLWPSLAPKVTRFSHYFIASSKTKLVISRCARFSFSCGSNPREVNFPAPAIPEDFLIKPWPKSSCWQLCINTSWQMLEFWEGSALDIPHLPMVPKYKQFLWTVAGYSTPLFYFLLW